MSSPKQAAGMPPKSPKGGGGGGKKKKKKKKKKRYRPKMYEDGTGSPTHARRARGGHADDEGKFDDSQFQEVGEAKLEVDEAELIKTREEVIDDYLADTRLKEVLTDTVNELYGLPQLPENPYLYIVPKLRLMEQQTVLWDDDVGEREMRDELLNVLTDEQPETNLCTVDLDENDSPHAGEEPRFWGLAHLSQLVDDTAIRDLHARLSAVDGILVEKDDERQPGVDSVQVMTALVGNAVFYGRMIPYLDNLTVHHEYIVEGPKFEKAVNVYANMIIKEAFDLEADSKVIVTGVYVTMPPRKRGEKGKVKPWSLEAIKKSKNSFLSAVKTANVQKKQRLYIEALFLLPDPQQYVLVRKVYNLHYKGKKGKPRTFCLFPYESLSTGIFFNEDDAATYGELFDHPDLNDEVCQECRMDLKKRLAAVHEAGDVLRWFEMLLMLAAWADRTEVFSDVKRMMDSVAAKLHALTVENDTVQHVVAHIVSGGGEGDEKKKKRRRRRGGDEFEHQKFACVEQFSHYDKRLRDVVKPNECSEVMAVRRSIEEFMATLTDPVTRKLVIDGNACLRLRKLNFFCRALELTVAKDVVELCTRNAEESDEREVTVNLLVNAIVNQVTTGDGPKHSGLRRPRIMCVDVEKEVKRGIRSQRYPASICKEATILQYTVDTRLDTALQSVLMSTMSNALIPNPFPFVVNKLIGWACRHALWGEPDSHILAACNTTQLKMIHLSSYTYRGTQGGDEYGGGSEDKVFGSRPALRLVNPQGLHNLWSLVGDVVNKLALGRHSSQYMEEISTAITGNLALHGRMTPVGTIPDEVDVHEDYVFEGPQLRVALELFAGHVLKYCLWLHDRTPHLLLSMCTGEEVLRTHVADSPFFEHGTLLEQPGADHHKSKGQLWTSAHIKKDKEACLRDIQRAARQKEVVCMRALMQLEAGEAGSAYVMMVKHFVFHFKDAQTGRKTSHCPAFLGQKPLFRNVYFMQSEATNALDGLGDGRDPEEPENYHHFAEDKKALIARAVRRGDLLLAYKYLLVLQVARGDLGVVPDVTRMFSSIAERLHNLECSASAMEAMLSERTASEEFKLKSSMKVLKQQFADYKDQVIEVLSSEQCIYLTGIKEACMVLLDRCEKEIKDDNAGKSLAHVKSLEELSTYLRAVGHSAAQAVHSNCPQIDEIFRQFCKEYRDV